MAVQSEVCEPQRTAVYVSPTSSTRLFRRPVTTSYCLADCPLVLLLLLFSILYTRPSLSLLLFLSLILLQTTPLFSPSILHMCCRSSLFLSFLFHLFLFFFYYSFYCCTSYRGLLVNLAKHTRSRHHSFGCCCRVEADAVRRTACATDGHTPTHAHERTTTGESLIRLILNNNELDVRCLEGKYIYLFKKK